MKRCSINLCTEVAELTLTFSKLTPHNQGYALAILRSLIFAQENGDAKKSVSRAKKSTRKESKSDKTQDIVT